MSKKKDSISLADLDAAKLGDTPFEFEYLDSDGKGTGIFFSVLGAETETVTAVVAEMINERRKKEAHRKMKESFRNKKTAEFEPLESDVEFGQRLAAVRLVGWRGRIVEEYTPERALVLCTSNRDIAAQVTEQSDDTGNFLKL